MPLFEGPGGFLIHLEESFDAVDVPARAERVASGGGL
jgi:hypothetical protein